jgi:methyl-accepting chemotaxis protein
LTAQGRVHAPKGFGYHLSKLCHTEVETIETGKQGLSASNPDGGKLGVFGMTPLKRGGKGFANVDVGAVLPKGVVGRAVHSLDGRIFKKLSSAAALTDIDAQGNAQGNAAGFRAYQV